MRCERRERRYPRTPAGLALALALIVCGPLGHDPASAEAQPPQPVGDDIEAPRHLYCPVCGARNRSGSRFCLKDGSPLPAIIPALRASGFIRLPETYSPEEIQEFMDRVSESVVRVWVKTTSIYKYPVVFYEDEEDEYYAGAMTGKVVTSDMNARMNGSGFVVSEDGKIVTNAHVANPDGLEADLSVELRDGRTLPARILGVDHASDLALLKVEADSLTPLSWGDSRKIRVGQETWAIGYPLGIGMSVARGTVSGLGGMRIGINQVESFLHSDAIIAPGNSGGPLVDVLGNVLGVIDIKFTQSKGQGYSIPSRMARLVISRLERDGAYERGFIGLHVRPVDAETIRKFTLKRDRGSVVESVLPGSPAARAGFRPGDVLYGINGRLAESTYLLQEAVSSVGPGKEIRLRLDREGETLVRPVVTIERPMAPRIDPVTQFETHTRIWFEEDKRKRVIIRDPNRSRRAPGLYAGRLVKSVLPAQDWPEEPITLNYFKTRAKPIPIDSLDDLRAALGRAYLGGRMAATFHIDNPHGPIVSVAFDELWPIIL